MILLHEAKGCGRCRDARLLLDELMLAHQATVEDTDSDIAHTLEDEGRTYHGHGAVEEHLEELRKLRSRWGRYPSDLCFDYGDDDETC